MFVLFKTKKKTNGGGRVVSASASETSVSSSMPTSAIIYDAYTSIIKIKKVRKVFICCGQRVWLGNECFEFDAC